MLKPIYEMNNISFFRAVFLQLNILYILPVIVLIFGNHFPFCLLKSRGLLVYQKTLEFTMLDLFFDLVFQIIAWHQEGVVNTTLRAWAGKKHQDENSASVFIYYPPKHTFFSFSTHSLLLHWAWWVWKIFLPWIL